MLRWVAPVLVVLWSVAADAVITPLSTASIAVPSVDSAWPWVGMADTRFLASPLVSADGAMLPIVVGVLVLLGLGGGVAWYVGVLPRTRSGDGAATTEEPTTVDESSVEPVGSSGAAAGDAQQELLSDEDRVVNLLEENGGRMKQVRIVDETEWSKSKVSMLLSDMEEEGQISKLRVGRENIISLAGEEPEAAGSPFDDE